MSKYKIIISFCVNIIKTVAKDINGVKGIDDFIDNCTMMNYYNKRLYMVETSSDNIKITTPNDYYIAKCIFEREDEIDG